MTGLLGRDGPARLPRAAALAFAIALAGGHPSQAGELAVATSIQPLQLIVSELGGERVRATALVPPGASPHAFEPQPSDLARLERARLFVRVGGGFDAWTDQLLAVAPGAIETVTLLEIPGLEPAARALRPGRESARPREAESDPAARRSLDPHVWLDPILVRDVIAPALVDHLAGLDPPGRAHYRERLDAFRARLTRLDGEIRSILDRAPGRSYVAFHNAWRYFAGRYGLTEIAVVHEFVGEEPTPRELAALVDAARRAGVPAILVEPQLRSAVARTLAAEFGGGTVVVDPLGDPEVPDRSSYEALLRFNARAFARACGGESG